MPAPRGDQGAPWYHTVAVARLAEGRFEDAQAAFEEILAENPEDTVARWNLGRAVSREVTVVAD
ncbi:MAG TPA: tetratricopeptide repeat protein [Treponemataceae bacterium]|nr:tetratricopeptide repeat protein [Treponemataceae bacterium]